MFGGSSSSDINGYDFFAEENSAKWQGIFTTSLNSVLKQVHQSSLSVQLDALEHVEHLILQLLATLCACEPHGVQDVEDRVQKTFPDPIDKWAIKDAERAIEKMDNKGKKNSNLVLPVDKIHPLLLKEVLGYRIDYTVTVYIVAVLEYIAADILKLTGNYVKNIKHGEITLQDIKVAICADQVLMDMFSQEETEVSLPVVDEPTGRESLTYEDIVKDFILEENQYLHDLNMIIKVFRAPFYQHFPRSKDLEVIFSNILDIYNFTANMLSSVEEQVEVAAENETPTVGICFQDIAEGEEFNVYEKYVDDMLAPQGKERLNTLLQRTDISQTLQKYGSGFKDAMKYVLPKLLLGPIYHCLHYFEVIKALISTSPNEEDAEALEQASGLLSPLKYILETKFFAGNYAKKKPWDTTLRLQGRTGRQAIVQKMTELQRSIDGWEGRDIWQSCSEFILDGVLNKHNRGRHTERHVFLFDALIVLCKPNLRRASVSGPQGEFKLKEKFNVRKITVRDREDCEDCKNAFEIHTGEHSNNIILVTKTSEEKSNWMAALISLQTRSMLERQLDGILREEEKRIPLRLPPCDKYRFAIEDSDDNIVTEDPNNSGESPLIKGGTLLKLVERLTYHMYADLMYVRTFLTTYRSFCSPQQLLDLLIERFEIPDLEVEMEDDSTDNNENLQVRDEIKRFRKEYVKPVQFRVVNVLRHWVDHHFYDFERDQSLLEKLKQFLDTVKGKAMRKMADSILKVIQRRTESSNTKEFTYQQTPPTIEWHLFRQKEQFEILTLHPIEIARQITLLEFDLYRAVKPSELVGSVWMKTDKYNTSPNLLKMIAFSNMLTFWIEKCIIEMENLEERVAVVCRCIEIMTVFQELNNFNGVLEVVSALNSASVHRLEHTFNEVHKKGGNLIKWFNEANELNSDHFKRYTEKLRSINPPCVPFLGMYLTNILKTEEGNPDFLKGDYDGLINFSKRRKVAEITGEIQQYQNQPYCLTVEPDIREYFENLNPMEDRDEKSFNDYLYKKSLEIEPRGERQIKKFPRKTTYNLKSPGIRPMSRHNANRAHEFRFPGFGTGYQRIDEDSESSSPQCMTPPTPTTPISPCSTSGAENGVFANVVIGQDPVCTQSSQTTVSSVHVPTAELVSLAIDEDPLPLQAPPLPPRRRNNRESSSSDVFRSGSPDPPRVPPRSEQPPPVPPRRDSMYNSNSINRTSSVSQSRTFQNVPSPVQRTSLVCQSRAQSVSQQPVAGLVQNTQVYSATLPRYHGDNRDSIVHVENVFSFNGENSDIPELPPRTYKTHSRNTSS